APWPPHPQGMDKEGTKGHGPEQADPQPTGEAMRDRALWAGQLNDSQRKGRDCRQGVQLNDSRGGEERSKGHHVPPLPKVPSPCCRLSPIPEIRLAEMSNAAADFEFGEAIRRRAALSYRDACAGIRSGSPPYAP